MCPEPHDLSLNSSEMGHPVFPRHRSCDLASSPLWGWQHHLIRRALSLTLACGSEVTESDGSEGLGYTVRSETVGRNSVLGSTVNPRRRSPAVCLLLEADNPWSRAGKTSWDLQEGLGSINLTVTAAGRCLYNLDHKGLK